MNLIIEQLKKQIEGFKKEQEISETGRVLTLNDGVCSLSGLNNVLMGELILFEKDKEEVFGVVLNLEEDLVGAIILGDFTKLKEGDIAKRTKKVLSIGASKNFIGRVINPLGEPLDKKGEIKYEKTEPLEKIAPGVLKREPVNTPLHTGIKSVDSMIPIGRGQRELIIGDRQIGKTALAIDTIINQKQDSLKTPVCIYVAIGQKSSKIAGIVEKLKEKGAMNYSIVISASASDPAPLWYIAPYAGCALGEYFMDKGEDVLIVYDDLSKHAWAYRQISLLLRRPPGREAYPGDVFYLHSRLLERSAKLSFELGGGSITALPIVETQAGDVSAYIPTNIISITDGQIYLEPELFYQGIRPALNVGLSVSRVGSAAQTKAMKKVAGKLRLDLAQFRELASFAQFSSDLDEITKQKIDRGQRVTEILKQRQYAPLSFEKQVCILYAATQGMLDDIEVSEIKNFENKFLEHLENQNAEFLKSLREKKDLTDELEKELKNIIENFKKVFRK
ncbi:MAG: F0F1 ATP synthase subunit alpha [Candidatus Portnoybacteria bacterium RIFCSPLOWO2_01_FULL_43_11]|uniref:ATP synthase subunit alpha n=4 Tax=Candidatus Portnoyibacteriota TaxID=1817913 RepID=A0A1G2FD95_9BACT|nr:MAG: F0F1 ATP synthase subunit alpha [Candidatus Portnoybacteria bacterium RIFCSPHIGHO2_01_FULL_40_12b]OGZ37189.1 MAG: F0F1 ATP synthase subunit alpha [Candidatus Portnoybacteria bacterium RIFCSPHIGHO2_02_FULL_40_23]OGZ38476.1 MAG: F0F1 ATP synthase subunit alpha [Candidatus Portnoybacteria bacterium RIFCSPHIGHO2_12_FULL_40_11]OGZ38836.1 MAG: F0F1 ATP synthase subunit alpha [Candidatus Portnoybacteria bacterium RIFCSPLOWO2_01_FULL_43_11]OGZ40733.1 MAG: F0F1 ATP synthase subunit alpha [Candid